MWEEKKEARVKVRPWFLHGKTTHPQPLHVEGLGVVEVQVRAGRPRSQFSFSSFVLRSSSFVLRPSFYPPTGGKGGYLLFHLVDDYLYVGGGDFPVAVEVVV